VGTDVTLQVTEYAGLERLNEIQKEWDELVLRENLGPAHQFEWLRILQQVHSEEKILVLILRRGSDLVGCAPMVLIQERRKGVNARVLQPLNIFHQLRGTQLAISGGEKELLEAMMEFFRSWREPWDLWIMCFQDGEKQARIFEDFLTLHKLRFTKTCIRRSPYLPLEGTWEKAVKQMQPRFRTTLRSRERKMKEKCNLELLYFHEPSDLQRGLEAIQEIERDSWKVREGLPITHPTQWSFYAQFARAAALNSSLRLPVLFLNREPLAYDFAVYTNEVYHLLKTSFKEKWHSDYPGFVLRKLVIEELYGRGAKEIDFGGNADEWKMKWTGLVRSQVLYTVYNRSVVGLYRSAWSRAGDVYRHLRKVRKKKES
jgi:CelD/BcsL family acetyltransferase involved in cellulose biosynthesis